MNKYPLVSIVIPIVREDKHINECLEAIRNSTYQNYEVIVVDEGKERSYQRNFGIKKAKGKYLLILDSDMNITPNVIEDCVNKMEVRFPHAFNGHYHYAGVYIPERIVTDNWFGRLRDWERQFYNCTLVDVIRFCRRIQEDGNLIPLFDEDMHGVEDSDWERRIHGPKTVCDYEVHHKDGCGVISYLKKKAYYAKCLGIYKSKNPNDRLLTFQYRCVQVFVENGKWKRFISKPHYALGVMLLIFARGVIFLCAKKS